MLSSSLRGSIGVWSSSHPQPGFSNPTPIIQTFYAEDQIFNDVKLHGVVTLVDAKHGNIHLDDVKPKGVVNEAAEQIAYADRITVNETDLVGEPQVASLIQRIKMEGFEYLKESCSSVLTKLLQYIARISEHSAIGSSHGNKAFLDGSDLNKDM